MSTLAVCDKPPRAGDPLPSAPRFGSAREREARSGLSYGAGRVGDTNGLQLLFGQKEEEPSKSKTSPGLGEG